MSHPVILHLVTLRLRYNAETIGYYTTDGKKVPSLQRGNINLIRYSDGTAKKVLVK